MAAVFFGAYPMTIAQLNAWAKTEASKLSHGQCIHAEHALDLASVRFIRKD